MENKKEKGIERAVKLKDGRIATVIKEWNWKENPNLKIYKDNSFSERLYEDFVDIELDGQLKNQRYHYGPKPINSNYHHVYMTVCKKDVEFIKLT